jgi:hypothetical protein
MQANTYWKPNGEFLLMKTGSWYATMITEWDGEMNRVLAMNDGNGWISICYPQPNHIEAIINNFGELGILSENRYIQHQVPAEYFVNEMNPTTYYSEAPKRNQQIQFSHS